MTTKKLFSALGPVALAAAVGMGTTGAAHALMIDGGETGVTYAKETLRVDLTSSRTGDATKYYDIVRDHTLVAPAQVSKTVVHDNERYTISFELTGMVFAEQLSQTATDPDVASLVATRGVDTDGSGTIDGSDAAPGTADYSLFAGGAKGDSYAVFQVSGAGGTAGEDGTVLPTDILTLTAKFAVSVDGGSITRTIANTNLQNTPGVPESVWMRAHTISNAVMVGSALKESVSAMGATAMAAHDFMAFGGTVADPKLSASLGSVELGVKMVTTTPPTYFRDAQATPVADDTTTDEVDETVTADVRMLSDIIAPKALQIDNPVTFSGDVSFLGADGKVALSSSDVCSGLAGETDLRVPSKDDPEVLTDALMATDANDFTSPMHLCLMVDGETPIPAGSYSVETKYAPKSSSYAFAAPGATHALGAIMRDGTTVQIPYLTTYSGYNQRLILRNRSGRAVTYTLTFKPEMGITASPTTHSGTLAADTVEMIRVQDIVELAGGNRTTATVTSTAAEGNLGVATTVVNMETRGTDTETHSP